MNQMPAQLRSTRRWQYLERAHIISHPYLWPRTHNLLPMLPPTPRQRDRRGALGQIRHISAAAPRSTRGRCPRNNTRRTHAELTTSIPTPAVPDSRPARYEIVDPHLTRLLAFWADRTFTVNENNSCLVPIYSVRGSYAAGVRAA
ncbi:DUF3703 domain-containing protein (plasmid) [Rhodococcus qingshengii]|nr:MULTISPECIES: DUF3703 domain-containing protein [Rhodococcus]UGQ55847.1 DUF3703 domain-containing protein [Rhodococcus qingshengii]BDQ23601.1 DUF3703 domain-containing protein [Rhodococcus qingshengii]